MPNKIVDLDIDKVASVDRAANQRKFLIIKRNDNEEEEIDSLIDGIETVSKIGRKISGKRMTKLMDLLGKFQQFMDEVNPRKQVTKEERMDLNEKLDAIEDEDVKKHFTELQEKADGNDELVTKNQTLQDEIDELKKSEEPPKEDITKGASDELIAKFDELKKEANEATELSKQLKEDSEIKKYDDEAKEFKNLGNGEVIAKVLRQEIEGVRELFKAANERISVTDEIGKSQSLDDSSATFKLDTMAKKYATDNNITPEKALNKVLETPEGQELWQSANDEKEVN